MCQQAVERRVLKIKKDVDREDERMLRNIQEVLRKQGEGLNWTKKKQTQEHKVWMN